MWQGSDSPSKVDGFLPGSPIFISSPEPDHGPASARRRLSSVHKYKDLLLRNCLANQSQILCGASLGNGNESLFAASGRHALIW